jgi:hypothetical protein
MTPTLTTLAVREHIDDLHRQAERSRRAYAPRSRRSPSFPRMLARRAARVAAAIVAAKPVAGRPAGRRVAS